MSHYFISTFSTLASATSGIHNATKRCPPTGSSVAQKLHFGEPPGRFLIEVAPEHIEAVRAAVAVFIGESTGERWLHITHRGTTQIDAAIADLKAIWQGGLVPYY